MPNHCSNKMVVTGTKKELDAFIKAARGRWPWDRGMSDCDDKPGDPLAVANFDPPPANILKGDGNVVCNWTSNRYGTKWGAYDCTMFRCSAGTAEYEYQTAWSPLGTPLLQRISKQFPGLTFTVEYDEPGMEFDGVMRLKGGDVLEDSYCEGKDYTGRLCGKPEPEEEEAK